MIEAIVAATAAAANPVPTDHLIITVCSRTISAFVARYGSVASMLAKLSSTVCALIGGVPFLFFSPLILVVDDVADIQEIVSRPLRKLGL